MPDICRYCKQPIDDDQIRRPHVRGLPPQPPDVCNICRRDDEDEYAGGPFEPDMPDDGGRSDSPADDYYEDERPVDKL